MTRPEVGPPCPKPARVRDLIEFVGNELELLKPSKNITHRAWGECFRDIVDALDWLATMLENRSLYHKKQQVKNKIVRALAREYGLDDQANALTSDAIHTLVSNQEPDKQDIIDLTELENLQRDDTNAEITDGTTRKNNR